MEEAKKKEENKETSKEDLLKKMQEYNQKNIEDGTKEIDEILKRRGLSLTHQTVIEGLTIVQSTIVVVSNKK